MKTALPLLLLLLISPATFAADDAAYVQEHGTLLFEDDFDRDEAAADKEAIGNGWTTNSAWRAKGKKQVDLADGAMHVTRAAEADHAVAIFHDAALENGAVQLKFKLQRGDDLSVDFVDRELKEVHAGHLCVARITLKDVSLRDSKTGVMDNKIRERRLAGDKSPELAALLKTKSASFPVDLTADAWHRLLVVVEGDQMRVTIDGKPIGEFKSEGVAHPTKRIITLGVGKNAWVDEVKVWKTK
ncbi:MAG TPA: hypothetical protein VHY20_05060 [Pirellulales bacterium]|nr:hypothetical protein [Pirellulales bacterium]